MNRELHNKLFELYISGALELKPLVTRGSARELIIDLETSALTPDLGDIIRYRAVNVLDEKDEFDEWAKPSRPLLKEVEHIVGVTNEHLDRCRPSAVVLRDFCNFIEEFIFE